MHFTVTFFSFLNARTYVYEVDLLLKIKEVFVCLFVSPP